MNLEKYENANTFEILETKRRNLSSLLELKSQPLVKYIQQAKLILVHSEFIILDSAC